MNIRFTSSLTPEDENAMAPAIITALKAILDLLPIAYMIRIDTSDANVYQYSGAQDSSALGEEAHERRSAHHPPLAHR
jgi:hypothetical protein